MENQKELWCLKGNNSYIGQEYRDDDYKQYDRWEDISLFTSKEKAEEYVKKYTRDKPKKELYDTIKPFDGPLSIYSEIKIEQSQKQMDIDPEQ